SRSDLRRLGRCARRRGTACPCRRGTRTDHCHPPVPPLGLRSVHSTLYCSDCPSAASHRGLFTSLTFSSSYPIRYTARGLALPSLPRITTNAQCFRRAT